MINMGDQIKCQYLNKIKEIVEKDKNGDKFIIVRTEKNTKFMRNFCLNNEDVKNIVKQLSLLDCYSGPEKDRDDQYCGFVFKYRPIFEGEKLYIKIRVENDDKSVCISIHKYGEFDEVK